VRKPYVNWRLFLLGILLLGNLLVWSLVSPANSPELSVTFLDVGQGDAILLEAPGGNQVLIDGGPGRQILGALGRALPFYDRSLDLVILSHADTDHVGGLPLVFERYRVSGLAESGVAGEASAYAALKQAAASEPAQVIQAGRGTRIELGGGAVMEVLSPSAPPPGLETNQASLVIRLVYGETAFLFTGDAPAAVEKYLVRSGDNLKAQVLKAGHHGADTSTTEEILAAAAPEYLVISVGAENRYGHPSGAVLERAAAAGARVLRTDEAGAITLVSDGARVWLK
jgi:competence protein ComEC